MARKDGFFPAMAAGFIGTIVVIAPVQMARAQTPARCEIVRTGDPAMARPCAAADYSGFVDESRTG